jgi:hypothetical protein
VEAGRGPLGIRAAMATPLALNPWGVLPRGLRAAGRPMLRGSPPGSRASALLLEARRPGRSCASPRRARHAPMPQKGEKASLLEWTVPKRQTRSTVRGEQEDKGARGGRRPQRRTPLSGSAPQYSPGGESGLQRGAEACVPGGSMHLRRVGARSQREGMRIANVSACRRGSEAPSIAKC